MAEIGEEIPGAVLVARLGADASTLICPKHQIWTTGMAPGVWPTARRFQPFSTSCARAARVDVRDVREEIRILAAGAIVAFGERQTHRDRSGDRFVDRLHAAVPDGDGGDARKRKGGLQVQFPERVRESVLGGVGGRRAGGIAGESCTVVDSRWKVNMTAIWLRPKPKARFVWARRKST